MFVIVYFKRLGWILVTNRLGRKAPFCRSGIKESQVYSYRTLTHASSDQYKPVAPVV